MAPDFDFQPRLSGDGVELRPLTTNDREALYKAVGVPRVWEAHPAYDRWKPEKFAPYFDGLLALDGALAIIDTNSDQLAGTSSFYTCPDIHGGIAIGYTVIGMDWRGSGMNQRMKAAVLNHVFRMRDECWFHVAPSNLLSQNAMTKLGAKMMYEADLELSGQIPHYLCYRIARTDWFD